MRFLVDAQLPTALARWISAGGHIAEHVADIDMASTSDSAIWNYASQWQSIIVTKDEDFAQRRILSENGPSVLWLRIRNTRKQELLTRFPGSSLKSSQLLKEVRPWSKWFEGG